MAALDEKLERLTRKRIGDRIKSSRDEKNYSLNNLAKQSGVSASTIHKIEKYTLTPTVTTLLKIAKGLRKDLNFFIQDEDLLGDYKVIRNKDAIVSVIKPQRALIRAASSRFADTHLEVHHNLIDKGGSNGKESLRHGNEEVAICLKGKMEFVIGKERVILGPLDSIHIRGGVRHRWRNASTGKTEMLFIFTPPLFS